MLIKVKLTLISLDVLVITLRSSFTRRSRSETHLVGISKHDLGHSEEMFGFAVEWGCWIVEGALFSGQAGGSIFVVCSKYTCFWRTGCVEVISNMSH
jgi:hypothetical protein